jgi:PST family polysaccharide transporter
VLAEPLIAVVFGPQWLGSAPVLRIYCVVGASHVIGSTTIWIYQARGRTDWLMRWGLVAAAITIAGIALGAVFGTIESVAIGYAVATVLVLAYPRFAVPGRLIGLRVLDVVAVVVGPAAAALTMAATLYGAGLLLSGHVSRGVDLGLRAAVGLVFYLVISGLFKLRGLGELRRAVRSRLGVAAEEP